MCQPSLLFVLCEDYLIVEKMIYLDFVTEACSRKNTPLCYHLP